MIPLSVASFLLVWSTAYSVFVKRHIGSALIRLLHENDIMTAMKGDQWRLGSWSVIQGTKPGGGRERTSKGMPGLSWMRGMCFWACQLAVWSTWALDVDKIVLGLSEVREEWSLQQTVSLELFHSFMACVTSHNTFWKTLRHKPHRT